MVLRVEEKVALRILILFVSVCFVLCEVSVIFLFLIFCELCAATQSLPKFPQAKFPQAKPIDGAT